MDTAQELLDRALSLLDGANESVKGGTTFENVNAEITTLALLSIARSLTDLTAALAGSLPEVPS